MFRDQGTLGEWLEIRTERQGLGHIGPSWTVGKFWDYGLDVVGDSKHTCDII